MLVALHSKLEFFLGRRGVGQTLRAGGFISRSNSGVPLAKGSGLRSRVYGLGLMKGETF